MDTFGTRINRNYMGAAWAGTGRIMMEVNINMYLANYVAAVDKLAETKIWHHEHSNEYKKAHRLMQESEARLLDAIATAIYQRGEEEIMAAEQYKQELVEWMKDAMEQDALMLFESKNLADTIALEKVIDLLIRRVELLEQVKSNKDDFYKFGKPDLVHMEKLVFDAKKDIIKTALGMVDREEKNLVQYKQDMSDWLHSKYTELTEEELYEQRCANRTYE